MYIGPRENRRSGGYRGQEQWHHVLQVFFYVRKHLQVFFLRSFHFLIGQNKSHVICFNCKALSQIGNKIPPHFPELASPTQRVYCFLFWLMGNHINTLNRPPDFKFSLQITTFTQSSCYKLKNGAQRGAQKMHYLQLLFTQKIFILFLYKYTYTIFTQILGPLKKKNPNSNLYVYSKRLKIMDRFLRYCFLIVLFYFWFRPSI